MLKFVRRPSLIFASAAAWLSSLCLVIFTNSLASNYQIRIDMFAGVKLHRGPVIKNVYGHNDFCIRVS